MNRELTAILRLAEFLLGRLKEVEEGGVLGGAEEGTAGTMNPPSLVG